MYLSPAQLAAVRAPESRVVVVAGAGSGKTRVLTERTGHLLVERGVLPERVVVLTFTRAAAAELRLRVGHLVSGEAAAAMYIGTFHGLAYALLQRHPEWAGRRPGWVLWEPADVAAAVARAAEDSGAKVRHRRDAARSVDVAATLGNERAARRYGYLLRRANALDYDALECTIVNAACEGYLDGLWDHVLVDEAQDCSPGQWTFVRALAERSESAHVYAVGDPRQSIYRFRGAAPEEFETAIGAVDWTTYRLSTNYRSRPGIVAAANRIARAMNLGLPDCYAAREPAPPHEPVVWTEAEYSRLIALMVDRHADHLSDVAVLARRWRDLDAVEEALAARGIPCRRLRRPPDPFDSPEGRVVLAALRLCVDPHDDLAAETLGAALGEDVPAARLRAATERRPLLECLPRTSAKVQAHDETPSTAMDVAAQVVDAAHLTRWELWLPEVPPADFLAQRAGRSQDEPAAAADEDAVTLSTVHSAKGLEWPVVYVVGCAEGAWPTASAARNPDDLAEERRLFYVACTRARDHLVVTSPATRTPFPGAAEEPCEPSRFVREMET